MKRMRCIFYVVIILTMLFSAPLATQAAMREITPEEAEIAGSLIATAINDVNTAFVPGNYTIGGAVPTYLAEEGQISVFEDAIHYLVYCDNNPVGVFTVNGATFATPTYTFGESFIGTLEETLPENASFSLVVSESQVFAVVDDEVALVAQYSAGLLPMGYSAEPEGDEDVMELPNGRLRSTTVPLPEEYTTAAIAGLLETTTLEETTNAAVAPLTVPVSLTRAFRSVGKIHTEKQDYDSNYCWLITAKVIGEKLNSKGYTDKTYNNAMAEGVGKYFGSGGNNVDIRNILTQYYGIPRTKVKSQASRPTQATIKTKITAKEPFAMLCYPSIPPNPYEMGHTMTCYGYDDAYAPYKLAVMDSLSGKAVYITTNGGNYYLTTGGQTYYWQYTVLVSR